MVLFYLNYRLITFIVNINSNMALRSSVVVRVVLIVFVVGLSWYTVQLYANLFGIFDQPSATQKSVETMVKEVKIGDAQVEDPDSLIDPNTLKKVEEDWENIEKNVKVPKELTAFKCQVQQQCKEEEFTFRIVSGAANVIGPAICFDGRWVMKNALNNVDRGMNVAIVNGKTGETVGKAVFDLYGKDSTLLKEFLKKLKEEDIVLITTYDDAAFKLDEEAKSMLMDLGSDKAKTLAFRDNWIFVGGKKLKHPTDFEQHMVNDKAKNKFGDWPEAITLEGCIPKLK